MRVAPLILLVEPVAECNMISKNGNLCRRLLDVITCDREGDFRERSINQHPDAQGHKDKECDKIFFMFPER